jgi:hypothetical protein
MSWRQHHVKVQKSKSGIPALTLSTFQRCLSNGVYQGSIQAVSFGPGISMGNIIPRKAVDIPVIIEIVYVCKANRDLPVMAWCGQAVTPKVDRCGQCSLKTAVGT